MNVKTEVEVNTDVPQGPSWLLNSTGPGILEILLLKHYYIDVYVDLFVFCGYVQLPCNRYFL